MTPLLFALQWIPASWAGPVVLVLDGAASPARDSLAASVQAGLGGQPLDVLIPGSATDPTPALLPRARPLTGLPGAGGALDDALREARTILATQGSTDGIIGVWTPAPLSDSDVLRLDPARPRWAAATLLGAALQARPQGLRAGEDATVPSEARQALVLSAGPVRLDGAALAPLAEGGAGASRWALTAVPPGRSYQVEAEATALYLPDLHVQVWLPQDVETGQEVSVWASLSHGDTPWTGPLQVVAELDGVPVLLSPDQPGLYRGAWRPDLATVGGPGQVRVRFLGPWFEATALREVWVDGDAATPLTATPEDLDLGEIQAGRDRIRRCATVRLGPERVVSRIPLSCEPTRSASEADLTCAPTGTGENTWEICLHAPSCCGDAPLPGEALAVTWTGPGTTLTLPVQATIHGVSLLRCQAPALGLVLGATGLGVGAWLARRLKDLRGAVQVALDIADLDQTPWTPLRALGSLGWSARVRWDAEGQAGASAATAILEVEGRSGRLSFVRAHDLHRLDPEQGWVAMDATEMAFGVAPGQIYRVAGGLVFRFAEPADAG